MARLCERSAPRLMAQCIKIMSTKKMEIWPIGIITAFAVFIGGIMIAVTIMVRNDVALTSDDYYAQEVAYQSQIDRSSRALTPDIKPNIKHLAATSAIEIVFPGQKAGSATPFSGKATFFRPSDPKKDFTMDLKLDTNGMQWVPMQDRSKGLWVVQIDWKEGGVDYYYEEQIMI